MCLFPFMMGGGPSNANEFAPPLAKDQQCKLYILGAVHLVMMITLMIAFHGLLGLGELFNCIILMCGAYSMNFCCMIFYIIIMLNDIITYFSIVGMLIQNNDFAKCYKFNDFKNGCDSFSVTMLIVFFVFSIIASYIAFQAYRIFKAHSMGMLEGGLQVSGPLNQGGQMQRQRDDENDGGAYPYQA